LANVPEVFLVLKFAERLLMSRVNRAFSSQVVIR